MSNIDKLVNKFYLRLSNQDEWQYFKSLLDEINCCIVESQGFNLVEYLKLAKMLILCLSPNVALVHNLVYVALENLCMKTDNVRVQVLLSFGFFYHSRKVEKVDLENYARVLGSYLNRICSNRCLTIGLLCSLLSNPEGVKKGYLGLIDEIFKFYPKMSQECMWVACISKMADSREIFRQIKHLKVYNVENEIILNSFLIGLDNPSLELKCVAIDTLYDKFSLRDNENHKIKVFIFSYLLKYISFDKVSMRIGRFFPDEIDDYVVKVLGSACNYLMEKNKFDLKILERIHEIFTEHNFNAICFYQKIIVSFIENIGKFCIDDKIFFDELEKILFDYLEIFFTSILTTFEKAIKSKGFNYYCIGLEIVKKRFRLPEDCQFSILNFLVDRVEVISPTKEYFRICAEMIDEKFPINVSNFLVICSEKMNSFSFDELNCFGEFYLKITKINPSIKINEIDLEEKYISESMLKILKVLTRTLKISLKYKMFRLLWDSYYSRFHDDIKMVLLYYSSYSEKWVKYAVKMLNSAKGFLMLNNFLDFCYQGHISELRESKFIFLLSFQIHEKIKCDYSLKPYLSSLYSIIYSDVPTFYDHHFALLLEDLTSETTCKNLKSLQKTISILSNSISKKSISSLKSSILKDSTSSTIKSLKWFKISVLSHLDLLLYIFYKYLSLYKSFKTLSISIFYFLQICVRHFDVKSVKTLLEVSYECLNSSSYHISAKVLMLKVLNSINFSKILEKEKDLESFLKNSYLNRLADFTRQVVESKENKKNREILISTIELYRKIWRFYINKDLINLIPMYYIKFLFIGVIKYSEINLAYQLLEFLNSIEKNIDDEWVVNFFLLDSPNLIDTLIESEKSNVHFLHILRDATKIIARNRFVSEGLIQLWSNFWSAGKKVEEIDGMLKYLPFFNLNLDLILWATSSLIQNCPGSRMHGFYLEFLYKYCEIYQYELDISQVSLEKIGKIVNKTNLAFTFIQLTNPLYNIMRFDENRGEISIGIAKTIRSGYLKFFNNLFQYFLTPDYPDLTQNNTELSKICKWIQNYGYPFISLLIENEKERYTQLNSWLQSLCKHSIKSKVNTTDLFKIFKNLSRNTILYSQYFRPTLLSIVKNNEILLETFTNNPKAVFNWCEVLNQCSSHSKLFDDFLKNFLIKKVTRTFPQECARLCFITSILIYTGDMEDYINPTLIATMKQNILSIISLDVVFPIAALNLMILALRLSPSDFFSFFSPIWPLVSNKYHETLSRPDGQILASLLYLFELLVALDFPLLSQLPGYSQALIISPQPRPHLFLNIPQNFTIKDLKAQESSLIRAFNTIYSETLPFTSSAFSQRIEEEFTRVHFLA